VRAYVLIVLLLVTVSGLSHASDDSGTLSPFSLGTGASELSRAGSNIASSDAGTCSYWNPSLLAVTSQNSFTGFHSRLYESDIAYNYFGLALPTLDFGGFGLGVFWQNTRNIERRDAANLYLGEISDNQLRFYFAYGKRIAKYNVGLSATFGHHSMGDYRATTSPGVNLSIGRQFAPSLSWLDTLSIVASARNIVKPETRLEEEDFSLPLSLEAGVALAIVVSRKWEQSVNLSAAVKKTEFGDARSSVGLEYSVSRSLFIRSGASSAQRSIGLGVKYSAFSFDYALVDRDLGSLHMFSISTGLGSTVAERRKARTEKQETEFRAVMDRQIRSKNQDMVEQLIARGQERLRASDLKEAYGCYERALFIARTNGADTTEVHGFVESTRDQLAIFTARARHSEFIDSAEVKLASDDYLAARYFANLARAEFPESDEAKYLLEESDSAIRRHTSMSEVINEQLMRADSLLSAGQLGEARSQIMAIKEFAPDVNLIAPLIVRLKVETWRETAYSAHADQDFAAALAALDSVDVLLSNCRWCTSLRNQIDRIQGSRITESQSQAQVLTTELDPDLEREVKSLYESGKLAFERGELPDAMDLWESVEDKAPNYKSVRKYLIDVYRFIGVDLYSRKMRQEALNVWKKAIELDPKNVEIKDCISRAENEIRRLREFSYDD